MERALHDVLIRRVVLVNFSCKNARLSKLTQLIKLVINYESISVHNSLISAFCLIVAVLFSKIFDARSILIISLYASLWVFLSKNESYQSAK